MKRYLNKVCNLILIVALVLNSVQVFGNETKKSISNVINHITYPNIAPGVSEERLTLNISNKNVENFVLEVDLTKQATIIVGDGYKNPDNNEWGMTTTRSQAEAEIKNGKTVVAGINGDFYNTGTGQPIGAYIKNGFEIQPFPASSTSIWQYFGLKNDGTAIIGDKASYEQNKSNLKDAVGAKHRLITDGVANTIFDDTAQHPRSAVGIKADGKVVFFVADGRQEPYSAGLYLTELAQIMIELGCVDAINLDGGGSSTFITRKLGTNDLECDNKPSDGYERSVSNSLLVVSTATSDSTFSKAAITPEYKTYTPNSQVKFSAIGLDSSSAPATLPNNLVWGLSDSSFGTIDNNGNFTSTGKTGQVKVTLSLNSTEVGTTMLEIQNPNELGFLTSELSVDPSQTKDLGLIAKYDKKEVVLKDSDILWNCPSDLGTISDGKLTATEILGRKGEIKATLNELEAIINISIGQLPIVMYDFEQGLGNFTYSMTAGAGVVTSSSIVDEASGEPVRFGDKALKVDFNFTGGNPTTTLGVYAGPADDNGKGEVILGVPKAIGAWIYATEEAQGYWLRLSLRDSSNSTKTIDFTDTTGINWLGWKYVEAQIPDTYVGPFTTHPQTIRMMSTAAMVNAGLKLTKGSIYVDNIRAVYGITNDDLIAPTINPIAIDGTTVTTKTPQITATFSDNETGIDINKVVAYINGNKYTDVNITSNGLAINNAVFPNNKHKIEISVKDTFGNETRKSAVFTVNDGNSTTVNLESPNSSSLGGKHNIELKTNDLADIDNVKVKLKINKDFPVSNVIFKNSTSSAYKYENGILDIEAKGEGTGSGILATIELNVPENISTLSKINYEIISSQITYKSNKGTNYINSFYELPKIADINSSLKAEVLSTVIGRPNKVKVIDNNGSPVSGATVNIDNVTTGATLFSGTTGTDGIATVGQFSGPGASSINVYAVKDGNTSFRFKTQSLVAFHKGNTVVAVAEQSLEPFNIIVNAVSNSSTSKNITWLSSVIKSGETSILKIAKKSDGENSFTEVIGTNVEQSFLADTTLNNNGVVRINKVIANNLIEGETYIYKVGDGTNWSETKEFTLTKKDADVNFVILGDTQTRNTANLKSVLNAIDNDSNKYDFTLHTGDLVDGAGIYAEFYAVNKAISEGKKLPDIIHALGNHEYMGDPKALAAINYYNTPLNGPEGKKGETYSVEYGNVYVGVISFTTDREELQKQLDWLVQDANNSTKQWKIVLTHQPVYYTNPDGGNGLFKELLPDAMKQAKIDFVFSGHDHAYGRTEEKDGTIYFVCGSTGEKYYQAIDDGSFIKYDDTKLPMYMTISTIGDSITIKALRPDGTEIDSFTKSLFKDVISKSKEVLNNPNATAKDITKSISDLSNAIKEFVNKSK